MSSISAAPRVSVLTLNEFGNRTLYTHIVNDISLDNVPAWRRIYDQIENVKRGGAY